MVLILEPTTNMPSAVKNGDLPMVKFLCQHGANIHVADEKPFFWL